MKNYAFIPKEDGLYLADLPEKPKRRRKDFNNKKSESSQSPTYQEVSDAKLTSAC